jgi:hypothetical protein
MMSYEDIAEAQARKEVVPVKGKRGLKRQSAKALHQW